MKKELLNTNPQMTMTTTPARISKSSIKMMVALITCALAFTCQVKAQVGTWTKLTNNQTNDFNNGVMLLMTDGSVMIHTGTGGNLGDGTMWDKLTPDSTGNYLNGTFSQTANMTQERFSFSSAVLKSGYLYAAGGEYGTDGTQNGWHGEVYDYNTNAWTEITGSNSNNVISDGSCKLIDNGDVLQGLVDVPFPVHTVLANPTTNAYTAGPSSLGGSNESMWLKLPDGSVLFVNEAALTSERYIPSLNQWVADANVPDSLYDPYGYECGPGWMLPNGEAFFIGGTAHTAIYTPSGTNSPGHWRKGPDVPGNYSMPDAPGAMMINGKILFACSPEPTQQNEFNSPTKFYEYNYLDSTYTAVPAPDATLATQSISQNYTMLDLPNGQVLLANDIDNVNEYYLYTPAGAPVASGKPTITGITRLTCTTYMATGHGFNGISEGAAFGDENECDSNYPLFRFVTSTGRVYYARSYNWNSTEVQRGLKNDTAYFTLPPTLPAGSSYIYCVANGIASDSLLFTDSVPTLSSALTPPSICTGATFTYVPTSSTPGATYTWTRAAVTGISNAAITTPQTANPNETLVNTTSAPVTVTYAYAVTGDGCSNDVSVQVVVNPKPTAAFSAAPVSSCSIPDSVTFTNTTVAGSTYLWSFGDGGTSTAINPVYPYMAGGTYSVKLVATSACGVDSVTKASYINVTAPSAPTVTTPVNISCGGSATLHATATGTDTLKWFTQPTGGTQVGTGTTYVTPVLGSSTTYYVENYTSSAAVFCPPATDAFGTGSNYANTNFRSDVFNVNQACTLVSVLVYSSAAGNRTIQLQDSLGNVLQSATVNIPNGTSTVTLNFPLTVGTEYQLGCGDGSTTTNLYRNETGAAFPYSDPDGYITITGNNVPDDVHFYFFYDWKLQGPACVSARTAVNVNITNGLSISPTITNVTCNGQSNGSVTITPTGGTPAYTYNWSNGQTVASLNGLAAATYTVTVHDAGSCSGTASETVTQPNALDVSVTTTNATCSTAGSASATVTGGTTTYNYVWSNTATTSAISGLGAATYTLTVTDAHSCTATAQGVVTTSGGGITLTPSSTNVACNGAATGSAGVTVAGATGTVSYHWSNNATTASLNNIPAGTYIVTVSSTGGCSATSSATVSQPTALNISVSETNSGCGSPNGSASVSATGGTASYSYLWSTTATTASITGLAAANYTVTVTDSHLCTATSSTTISNSGLLNISAIPSATTCTNSNTGNANAVISGGTAPFNYHWSTGATTASITGVVAGSYQVTVSDNTGCSGSATVTIAASTALSLTTSATDLTCFNTGNGAASISIISGTSPYNYVWSNGSTTASITNLTAGNYIFTVTDAHNCQSIDTVAVTQPAAITIFVSAVQPSCSGLSNGSASVTATGGTPGFSYLWSNNATTTGIGNLAAGPYSVTLTDANSCTSSASFNVTNPVPVTATITAENDSCFGSSDGSVVAIPLGGTSPYFYLWSNSSTTSTVTGLAAGAYNVTITDNHNCSGTVSANITQPNQITDTTTSTNATTGQSNGSATVSNINGGTSPYSINWSNGQHTNTINNLAAGTYTVTVSDRNGCEITDTVVVNTMVGIETINSTLTFTIYPNPAKNEVTIEAGNLDKETALLLEDITGRTLIIKTINTSNTTTIFDLSAFADGVYFVELKQQDGKKAVKKLVISR